MNFINIALNVLEIESTALKNLCQNIDEAFQTACETILSCQGKLIVTGLGKSGLIGKKIAATLSSTGTPAIFLHPTEACHGDFGVLQASDVVLALSHSGYTAELCNLLPSIQEQNIPIISITSEKTSPLAQASTAAICYGKPIEACPLGLAPTTTSTIALALGDALAVALLQAKNFRAEDFAQNHPGGSLGKQFIPAMQLAHLDDNMPVINESSSLHDCLIEVSCKKLGMSCVVNADNLLTGVVTDGDIRRCLMSQIDIYSTKTRDIMNPTPKTITAETRAVDALKIMQNLSITSLVLVENNCPIGVLHIHDLLKAGFAH